MGHVRITQGLVTSGMTGHPLPQDWHIMACPTAWFCKTMFYWNTGWPIRVGITYVCFCDSRSEEWQVIRSKKPGYLHSGKNAEKFIDLSLYRLHINPAVMCVCSFADLVTFFWIKYPDLFFHMFLMMGSWLTLGLSALSLLCSESQLLRDCTS